jgi:hypothetical protein
MSVQGLQNPYERLQVLPTTMNWRGTWLTTQTYFKNDVVISPLNGASYILVGQTALNGGADPSASANFIELSPLSTGVQGITAGTAIGVDNTNPQNPVISNNGVRTVDGDGVTIVVDNTDPNNPLISSNSITILQPGPGISIDNSNPQIPVVGNIGVRQIVAADASVTVSNPTGIVTIASNGLLGVLPGPGIAVSGDPQNPEIANSGVVSLTVGDGLSSTGGVNPTIANTGVLSVLAADSSIIVGGTPQNVTIRTTAPVVTRIFSIVFTSNDFSTKAPGAVQVLNAVVPASPNIFRDYLATGAPDPTGIFMIDLTSIILQFRTNVSSVVINPVFSVGFSDGPNEYVSSTVVNDSYLIVNQMFPIVAALGLVYFNVADARAAGLTTLTQVRIFNNTNGTMTVQNLYTTFNGTYYPDGLQ